MEDQYYKNFLWEKRRERREQLREDAKEDRRVSSIQKKIVRLKIKIGIIQWQVSWFWAINTTNSMFRDANQPYCDVEDGDKKREDWMAEAEKEIALHEEEVKSLNKEYKKVYADVLQEFYEREGVA